MAPPLQRMDHVHIFVANRSAAETWYRDVLGFALVAEFEFWASDDGPLFLADPAGTVHLALFERPPQPCRSTVAMAADGEAFLAWLSHLSGVLGRTIEAVDHQLSWSLYFADPEGNPFEITSYDYDVIATALRRP